PISRSFDTTVEKTVRNGQIVRLKSIQGIKILDIGSNYITVKPVFFIHALATNSLNMVYKINLNQQKTVGLFNVKLLDINDSKAKIYMSNVFKAWEDELLSLIQPLYGSITVKDMINFSRFHEKDLNGLRPMCEDHFMYEAAAIFKIPNKNFETMSCGWFSANHACSSIYVPFHISNNDIYEPYKKGEAAELSINLLKKYGHGTLSNYFSKTEDVFLYEVDNAEQIAKTMDSSQKISDYLTKFDSSIQKQAYLTQQIWMETSSITNKENKQMITEVIEKIWESNYSVSFFLMKDSINRLKNISNTDYILNKVCEIAFEICKQKIITVDLLNKNCSNIKQLYQTAENLIKKGEYCLGFDYLEKAFNECEYLMKEQLTLNPTVIEKNSKSEIVISYLFIAILGII
ncbi:MAG: hypothetical protein ACQXXF_08765, partial [Thermoplasmatota archaeon]